MLLQIPAGSTSKIIKFPIFDSSSTTGALLTGLVFNTASLTAYYDREGVTGAATAITLVTATKGTWTSSGFVAVDGTNMPGWYELHVPDAAFAASAKSVSIHLKGATNMVPVPLLVELTATSNQDSVRGGMTALPNAAVSGVGGLLTAPTTANTGLADVTRLLGTAWLTPGTAGTPDVNAKQLGAAPVTATTSVTFSAASTVASTTNITAGTMTTTTNLTNLPAITANWLTAAGIAAGALDGKGNWNIGKTGYSLLSTGLDAIVSTATGMVEAAKAVWDRSLATHQTILTAGRATTLGGVPIAETTAAGTPSSTSIQLAAGSTVDNYYKDHTLVVVGGAGAGQAQVISGYIGSTKTCTFVEAFATVPTVGDAVIVKTDHVHPISDIQAGLATPTNITAGVITTVTNLTNAPTAGDLTATMKTSVTTAATSSTPIAASVTGAVGSVTAGVTVTTNNDKTGYALTTAPPTSAAIATAVLTTQMTESYRADGAAPTLAQAQCETLAHLGETAIAGTTKTIKKFDGTTSAETFTLDSATAPTSITRAT